MINVVSWNVGKRKEPWRELVRMAGDGDADVVRCEKTAEATRIDTVLIEADTVVED